MIRPLLHRQMEFDSLHRQRVSRTRRHTMVIRMRLHDGEPIGQALRRFNKLLMRQNHFWDSRRRGRFVCATQLRRRKKFQKRFKARQATLDAQRGGVQSVESLEEATVRFWRRTGKP